MLNKKLRISKPQNLRFFSGVLFFRNSGLEGLEELEGAEGIEGFLHHFITKKVQSLEFRV